ncbi:hypothetical protein [Mycolicibacterium elephantis]|uniref:hypothetical protein n=1 Tax=Mycolicibacterium elephantis TaxID=81858 RepID=UPI000AA21DD4|nr:hypothetical protein [Mycolicibacterium elephantis]
MTISAPNIVGPLTPASFGLRVSNVLVGGVVHALRNGVEIGAHASVAADMSFEFYAGVTLNAHEEIVAVQEFNGEASPLPPRGTVVQDIAPPYSGHRFVSHVFGCSSCLFLAGVTAGAELRLQASGDFLGSVRSVDGTAVIDLVRPVKPGEQVESLQIVNGVPGPIVTSPPADRAPGIGKKRIVQLAFGQAMECKPGFDVSNVIDGETLIVYPDIEGDPKAFHEIRVPVPSMLLSLPPLKAHQRVKVFEQLCERGEDQQGTEVVAAPLQFQQLPHVLGPLCAGTSKVTVAGLIPGAVVKVKQGDVVVGQGQASGGSLEMWVTPLAAGEVFATEELCTKSCSGPPEPVVASPAHPEPCEVIDALFDCSNQVWYRDARPGAWLACFSTEVGQLSDWVQAPAAEGVVHLHTPLKEGHHVLLRQSACGAEPQPSRNIVEVQKLQISAPVIQGPLYIDQPRIKVSAIPGALVQLYTRDSYVGHAVADHTGTAIFHSKVSTSANLYPLDYRFVKARQLLCDRVSSPSPEAQIKDRRPLAPTIIAPSVGEVGTAVQPLLRWSDPGAGTKDAAVRYFVYVSDASNPQLDENKPWLAREVVTTTQLMMPHELQYSKTFHWFVQGILGEPGFEVSGPRSVGKFTTMNQPVPQEGDGQPPDGGPPSAAKGNARVLAYNCYPSRRPITIYVRNATEGGPFEKKGTLDSQYTEWGTCGINVNSVPLTIPLKDGQIFEIVAVDPGNDNCPDGDPLTLGCRANNVFLLGNAKGGDFIFG